MKWLTIKVKAEGIIAIGIKAEGYIAIGLIAKGKLISLGNISIATGCAIGVFALGGVISIGVFAASLIFALGVCALGGIVRGLCGFGIIEAKGIVTFTLFEIISFFSHPLKTSPYYFSASLDKDMIISTIISFLITVLFIAIPAILLLIGLKRGQWKEALKLNIINITSKKSPFRKFITLIIVFILGLVFMISIIGIYFRAPCGYSITESSVIIHQRHPEKQIIVPIKEITSVWRDIKGAYRIGWILSKKVGSSSHGIFGTFGSFSTFKFGWVDLYYVTNRDNLIVLEGKRKIVISPDNPERFIKQLKERLIK